MTVRVPPVCTEEVLMQGQLASSSRREAPETMRGRRSMVFVCKFVESAAPSWRERQ